MTLNSIAYIIYLGLTSYIILVVGNICYKNGNIYVGAIIKDDKNLCLYVNRLLLVAYYLMNIGYCATTLIQWETIINLQGLIELVAEKTAFILCIISILHYMNIYLIKTSLKRIIN